MITKSFSKTIRVEFIDNHTKQIFSFADMQVEQLPDSFELNTILTIENSKWVVVRAEPMQSSEFKETRYLKLYLNKIEIINSKKINFSLPTISGDIPNIKPHVIAIEKDLRIHLDDWRQIEFFSLENTKLVENELNQIKFIKEHHRLKSFGYSNIHARNKIKQLIANHLLTVNALISTLNVVEQTPLNISVDNGEKVIVDGFAFNYCDNFIYGVADKGVIDILCLYRKNYQVKEIILFMKQYNLGLVDWVVSELFV